MGWTIGIPSLKLSSTNNKSKHCGNFYRVAAEALQERLGRDQDINHELSHLNIYYGFNTAEELVNYSNAHCSTLTDAKGRKIRSDSVRMCVTILKPPAAYMASLTYDEQRNFLNDGINKIKELVREDNIKSIAIHFDEQGPHAHVFWEPITVDGRLCAKELHGLKFFSRLNNELPRHLRACGWNIDDCNAYDQAQASLLSEQEKAEQRRKNGRSSSVFKAEIEIKRNRIEAQVESALDDLEKQVESRVENSLEDVFHAQDDTYNDALFLMTNCDDIRFNELSEEGRRLKKLLLYKEMQKINYTENFRPLVEQICAAEHREVSWEARMQMWKMYRQVSDEFWQMRKHLDYILSNEYHSVYSELYQARQSYYDAIGFLRESRNVFTLLIATVWALHEVFRENELMDELSTLKYERKQLYANTRSFKYYCAVYRSDLKAGVCPIEKYMNSMQTIVERLDNEYQRFKDLPQIERLITPQEIDKFFEITPD